MEKPQHTLSDLFAQLGLSEASADIDAFVARHSTLERVITVGPCV